MGRKMIVSIIIIILTIILVGCQKEEQGEQIGRTEIFMGTPITITLHSGGSKEILDKAFGKVSEIENLVSINKEGTELYKLNKNAGKSSVKLSDTSYKIIKKAIEYSKLSDGGYDISIGPLVKLWSIGLEGAKVPTKEEIDEVIKLIDYSKVKINDKTKEVFLSDEGMMLDLGSIAKGYTADELANLLREEGVKEAIIDLGGNIYALGSKEGNKEWKIGIQNPFDDRGSVVGSIEVANKSIVTTGVYERFIEENDIKYHHILNPKTGYPYKTEIAGVSIIADYSVDADALSTLVFTKGLEEGFDFVESLENIDAIFITNDKEVYITEGIKETFNIMDNDFKLCN
ncbi:FAD:protein FMN transferase [Romboutsia sp. 1001216sp1]|uniref:FAD:protein FMN transferase n=1 Tax=Romboutsia TaxID=1501226 RepID=UPI000A4ACEED|nr:MULTISPECIES: FAD:protein FMN transferase [Romboutsia]MDB8792234.1 FAD:protein FMN transferase [Romboutsia sp. 1001216sp1]MDB8795528.1 FAD:protein FMN transferase [Romboutsia sp. 1001216sp1]MDB8798593.1 FAD:protein FMN transferase [Romboutsia sp. 1001216sp1]